MGATYLNLPSLLTQFYPTYDNVTKVLFIYKTVILVVHLTFQRSIS